MHPWLQDPMIYSVKEFRPTYRGVKELRFLLCGPVGAGKSSMINTMKAIFHNKFIGWEAASDGYRKYNFGNAPFTFFDVMGMEEGVYKGVHPDDIINALKGHIPENYTFRENDPIDEDNRHYILNPTLTDQIHCLVCVIAADKISMMDEEVIQKMKTVRRAAYELKIPQVLFMTRVDKACTMSQNDLTKVYQSKKIKEKVSYFTCLLGFALNCIFPVKNYSEETKPDEKLNCLMLDAFTKTLDVADEFVNQYN
uniref:G domain-containing protein n=1 Tax=Astyanax mexicanus TaxID=7994 RepID=A0A3B1IXR6_ASTMX